MEFLYIEQILAGDIPRFAYFVDTYKDMAYTIAFRIVNNREDTEEVVQDAFVKAYTSLHTFRQDSKFSTWLYKIVVNMALSKIRKKKLWLDERAMEELTCMPDTGLEDAYKSLVKAEQEKIIQQALGEMSMEDSLLLTLYYLQEQTLDEIEEITGIPKENAKVKIHRARKKMYLIIDKKLVAELKYSI